MVINTDTIIKAAEIITAMMTLVGVLFAGFKLVENEKKQDRLLNESLEERQLLVEGMRACLDGVIQLGGNGPCKKARAKLDEALNALAHRRGGEKT